MSGLNMIAFFEKGLIFMQKKPDICQIVKKTPKAKIFGLRLDRNFA